MAAEPAAIKRPVRAAGFTFLGLVALFAACTSLMPDVDPAEFFLAGLGYSLLLAAFAVGLMLAGRRARVRWLMAGAGVMLAVAGFGVWVLAAGPVPSAPFFRTLPWVLRVLLVALTAYLAAGVVIAGSGWVRFCRARHRPDAQLGATADRVGGSG